MEVLMMRENRANVYRITSLAIMSAIIYVITMFRFPFLGSKVHLANSMCLVSGMLFGPLWGGIAAGFGSALYDALAGGYDPVNVLITFVSKFAMASLCGFMVSRSRKQSVPLVIVSSIAGAVLYVALYTWRRSQEDHEARPVQLFFENKNNGMRNPGCFLTEVYKRMYNTRMSQRLWQIAGND